MAEAVAAAKADGITHIIFGDLFLEDIRAYRDEKLDGTGITPVFPLWLRPTDALAREMIAGGLQAHLATVDLKKLPADFAGRRFDAALLARPARRRRSLRRERRIPLVRVCRADAVAADCRARRRDGRARRVCLCGFAGGVVISARPRESGDPALDSRFRGNERSM